MSVAAQTATRPRLAGVTIGFNGVVRNRAWAPLSAHLENPGPASIVRLQARLHGHSVGQILTYDHEVLLPTASRRQVEFPLWMDAAIPVEDPMGVRPVCDVILYDSAGRELERTDAMARVLPEEVFLVGIADARSRSYRFWTDRISPVNRRPYARIVMTPDRLPRRPLYTAVFDGLVLGDLRPTELSPLQTRALHDWIRRGGTLVVTPGGTRGHDAVWNWLPLDYSEPEIVETLPELVGDTLLANGVATARCRLRPGSMLWWGTTHRPLVAARREGLGMVVALAFDAGADDLQTWPGAFDFWQALWARCPQPFRYAQTLLERLGALDNILPSMAGVQVVDRPTVGRYLASVFILLGGVLVVSWYRGRGEWGWYLAVLLALGLSIGAVTAAAIWKAQTHASWNEVYLAVQTHGHTAVAQTGAVGIYSPREITLEFGADDDRFEWRAAPSPTLPPDVFPVRHDGALHVRQLRVRADDIRCIMTRSVSDTPSPPRATVSLHADGLAFRVQPPLDLSDAALKWNRFVVPLGDLRAERPHEWTALRETSGRYSQRLLRRDTDTLRDRLREVLFPDPVFEQAATFSYERLRLENFFRHPAHVPVLIGWTEHHGAASACAPTNLMQRVLGLWLLEAEVDATSPAVHLPAGVLEMHLLNRAAATLRVGDNQFQGSRPGEIIAEFRLPPSCPDLQLTEARLHVEFRGGLFRPSVWVVPPTATGDNWQPKTWLPCRGGPVYVLESPQQFYRPSTRGLIVALTIDPIPNARHTNAIAMGLSQWQVRRFELEVRGVRVNHAHD